MKIQGTIKELISMGLAAPGMMLDQPDLSVLCRYWEAIGIATQIGKTRTATKGKPCTVWEIDIERAGCEASKGVVKLVKVISMPERKAA